MTSYYILFVIRITTVILSIYMQNVFGFSIVHEGSIWNTSWILPITHKTQIGIAHRLLS